MFPRLVALFIIAMLVAWVLATNTHEKFQVAANDDIPQVNSGRDPWNRHPISSVPVDYDVRYKTMYMAEFDNGLYEQKLKNVFGLPNPKKHELSNVTKWTLLDVDNRFHTSYIRVAYDKLMDYIATTLNKSEELDLPYDNPYERPKIQIVHDVLLQFRRDMQNKYKYSISFDVILYRAHKFHGKHVHMEAIMEYNKKDGTWKIDIVDAYIIGIIAEDGIGMFPVVPYQEGEMEEMKWDDKSVMIIPSNREVINVLRRQNKLQLDNLSADVAVLN